MSLMKRETWREKIWRLWTTGEIHGLELLVDIAILALRYISFSYYLKDIWLNLLLDYRKIGSPSQRRIWRDNVIDSYCVLQFIVLLVLLACDHHSLIARFVAAYIIFEIYLNLCSIFFLRSQKMLGSRTAADEASAVNEPSTSVERSILLLFVNVLQVTLAFAIFYRDARPELSPGRAFFEALLVLGTVGYPEGFAFLIALQILLDLFLVAAILGSLIGRAGPFAKKG